MLTDDAERAARSPMNFLWTTFTRFEPAADIHAAATRVVRNHLAYTPPIVIDARMKPWFPKELTCRPGRRRDGDAPLARVLSRQWRCEMGDSERGHLRADGGWPVDATRLRPKRALEQRGDRALAAVCEVARAGAGEVRRGG